MAISEMSVRPVFCILMLLIAVKTVVGDKDTGFLGAIGKGMESVASAAAEFVSKAFGPHQRQPETAPRPPDAFRSLVRVLGLDRSKLGAVVVNAIVFVVHLIASVTTDDILDSKTTTKRSKPIINTASILNMKSPSLHKLVNLAKEDTLLKLVMENIPPSTEPGDAACFQQFACKLTPFVVNMQKSVFEDGTFARDAADEESKLSSMLRFLPTKSEIKDYSEECEREYPDCVFKGKS